jgi:RNA polymerase sigma-70 factor, ECF subfamily
MFHSAALPSPSERLMNAIEADPDLPLIQAMAAGDASALDALYERHGRGIFSFLMAHLQDNYSLAEEVLQDVMLAAWQNSSKFRQESKVRTWLLVIARNRAINARRRRNLQLVELEENVITSDDDTSPLEQVHRNTNHEILRQAIKQLPAAHQEILTLVFFQQLSGPEIALVLGISEGTVKSRLHRAKESLRRILNLTRGSLDV